MSLYDHYFSDLEKKYYEFCLEKRQLASRGLLPISIIDNSFLEFSKKLHTDGYVELPSVIPKNDLIDVQSQIEEYFLENDARILKNPLQVEGLYPLVKKYLVPFACSYYGCVPTISYIKIINSAVANAAKDTQFFHRDPGSYRLLKSIIYLNSVDSHGGPFVYIKKSHTENLKGKSGRERISDDIVVSQYGDSVKEVVGHAGHLTFFDAKGLHKGKLPEKSDRLAIIVNFSLHPEYGQKDNYSKVNYNMDDQYDKFDLMLLDSCVPIFGVENE